MTIARNKKVACDCMKLPLRPALPLLLLPLVAAWLAILLATECVYQGYTQALYVPVAFSLTGLSIVAVCWRLRKRRKLSVVLLSITAFFLAYGVGTVFFTAISEQSQQGSDAQGIQALVIIEDTKYHMSYCASEALWTAPTGEEVRFRVFWSDASLALPKGTHIQAHCTFKPLREDQRWLFEKGIVGSLSISSIEKKGFSQSAWGVIDSFRAQNVARISQFESAFRKELTAKAGEQAEEQVAYARDSEREVRADEKDNKTESEAHGKAKSKGNHVAECEGTALLLGILLGYREALDGSATEQDFITSGLTHLIAVSGSHLAVVAALCSWFLRRLPLRKSLEILALLFILTLYVMLTGLQPSAIRSAIMAGAAGCSALVGRRGHAPSALMAAALCMLIAYPPNAYSLGFWLSVCAVAGISIFTNLVAYWLVTVRAPGTLASAIALTLTANAATLPISAPTFAVLSLISPFANLVAGSLVSIVLVLGMLALVLVNIIEPVGNLLLLLAVRISDGIAWFAGLCAQIPYASLPFELSQGVAAGIALITAAALYLLWPAPAPRHLRMAGGALGLAAVLLIVLSPLFIEPKLVALDVGQGDALIVQEMDTAMLIDTGASESALVHALARNNITHLEAVIITHLDDDHAGALSRLRGLVQVQTVYFAQGLLAHQAHNSFIQDAQELVGAHNVKELACGDLLYIGNTLSLEVLWPVVTAKEGSNEESICLLLAHDNNNDGTPEQQALLTGDAESEELAQILTSDPALTADIIKIGHHGSKGALTLTQALQLESTLALISVGAGNRYGHPSGETLQVLEQAHIRTLRTDENGDLICTFKGTALELSYTTMNESR